MSAHTQDTSIRKYKASGRTSPQMFGLLLAGMLAAMLIGIGYGALTRVWSHILFAGLMTLLTGGMAGVAAIAICGKGHCRNRLVGMVVGLVLGGTALGASYWMQFQLDLLKMRTWAGESIAKDVTVELKFRQWMEIRKTYGFKVPAINEPFDGGFVEFVWEVEAVLLLGVAGLMGWKAAEAPYCEGCRKWPVVRTVALGGFDAEDFWSAARMGSVESIRRRPHKLFHNGSMALVLEGHVCEGCRATWVNARQRLVTKKGGKDVVSYKKIAKGVEAGKGDGEFFLREGSLPGATAEG